jgi:type II secretion system protein C
MGVTLKKYIWLLGLLSTMMISYLLAKMTNLFIESQFPNVVITVGKTADEMQQNSTQKTASVDIKKILDRNFFDVNETVLTDATTPLVDENTDEQVDETVSSDKAVLTTLDIKLISTLSLGNGMNVQSSCVIKSGREEGVYTLSSKESFAPSTKIVQILPKKVIFKNKKRLEYVLIQDFTAVNLNKKPNKLNNKVAKRVSRKSKTTDVNRDGDVFKISRSEVDTALSDINKLYTDIRAVPYFKDGKASGFKLLSVKRGSLFDKLGLRRGDILKMINGTVLDIQSGMQTFNTLKSESNFELHLERRGTEQSFKYEII